MAGACVFLAGLALALFTFVVAAPEEEVGEDNDKVEVVQERVGQEARRGDKGEEQGPGAGSTRKGEVEGEGGEEEAEEAWDD